MPTLAKARPSLPATPAATVPTLVVLANFFPESRRALRLAAELAAPLGAPLVLLHLNPLAASSSVAGLPPLPLASQRELHAGLRELASELGQPVKTEIAEGLLADTLADIARRYQSVVFVLGRPAGEQADFTLGDALLDELRMAQLPALLVPEAYTGPSLPQHLAIAADDEPFDLHAGARAARQLLHQLTFAQATVVAVAPVQDDALCAAALHHVRASGLLPAPALALAVEGFYHAQPEHGVLRALAALNADWLVVLPHPRHFLDNLLHHSVTRRLLHRSPVPVLVVPTHPTHPRVRRVAQLH
jgi:nucleotide-binding universal stress UspA family protein